MVNIIYIIQKKKKKENLLNDWRKRPCNVALHTQMGFVTPTGIEQRYVEDKAHTQTMPYVDGKKVQDKVCLCLHIINHILTVVLQHIVLIKDVYVLQKNKEIL